MFGGSMKKVLIATNLDLFCYKFLIPYFKYFKKNGYIVEIASKTDGSKLDNYDKKYNVDFPRRINIKEFKKAYKQIKKVLEENKYDIIFCHSPFGAAITRLAAKNCKLKNTTPSPTPCSRHHKQHSETTPQGQTCGKDNRKNQLFL